MDDLRAQFPVLERVEYLNAGTTGPVPRAALRGGAARSLRRQLEEGRSGQGDYFDACVERIDAAARRGSPR